MAAVTTEEINDFLNRAWTGSRNHCIEVGDLHAVATTTIGADQLRPGDLISGPTQFQLADAALYYAVFGAIGIQPMAVTSELSIRFLRPAIGTVLSARADLHTVGRRTIVGSIKVWTNAADRPVSVAQGTYLRPA